MNELKWNIEQQFQALLEFSPASAALINREGKIVQSNAAFQILLGYAVEELQKKYFFDFYELDDRSLIFEYLQKLLSREQLFFAGKYRCCCKKNGLIGVNLSVNAVGDINGLPQYAIAILESDAVSQPPTSNLQNTQLQKWETEQSAKVQEAYTLLNQERAELQKAQKALKFQGELTQALINLYPNTILSQGSFTVVTDANTLEAMESELQQTKAQLRAVLDAMPGFVCWVNSEGKYLGVNQHMADTFNLSPETFVGQDLSFLKNSPEFTQFMANFLADSAATGHHVVDAKVNGLTRHYLIAAQKYHQNSLAVSVGIDITERKLAEAQIQASLREKEVLLQEIHHRVKNNLQVISSLLDLQSQQLEEQAMLEVFRESQNRVKSMALVHEKLYQSKNFARINFAEYTESLTNFLFKAYELNSGNVKLELDIDEVNFNIEMAIPCGLIINELVSNALKYAFPNNRSGIIRMVIRSEGNNTYTMIVEDNGVGFPIECDLNKVKSLGLQLVNVLVKQLKGNLEIDQSRGSKFQIQFSENSQLKSLK